MIKERLWTRDFMALVLANGFLFAGFHFLLPTITLYAASLGATGGEIGLIGGIFGYSAICIRLFTGTGVHYLGARSAFTWAWPFPFWLPCRIICLIVSTPS